MLVNSEYIAIHPNMTTEEPMTMIHVMTVQLRSFSQQQLKRKARRDEGTH